jgi:polyferredoxin
MNKFNVILIASIIFLSLLFSYNSYAQTNDEFTSIDSNVTENEFSDEFQDVDDGFSEFEEVDGEFGEINESTEDVSYTRMWWSISILLFTILAGILVRFNATRKLRPLFLIASIIVLGFYRGGCPGPVSSIQNVYLFGINLATGVEIHWQPIILFLGLIPITYIFGKVFCGWICHLGALQEILNISKIKKIQSEKAQKVMRIIRIVILVALIIQLTFTHIIFWNKIGPFKVAYNLFSANLAGYILLGILILSSIFIHRPFCKTICPVGLTLGWITKIPGASILGINNDCAACKTCNTSCNINAITRKDKISKLDNQECILCGDCLSNCNIKSISFYNKGKKHNDTIMLKGIKKLK